MNTALIFAGGSGRRMNCAATPKQFLELDGKAIIVYTLEHFQNHPDIDSIAVVCIPDWIDHMQKLIERYRLTKVKWLVPGGSTSQESTRNGLYAVAADQDPKDSVVLIHDGVRPLINAQTITDNIESVKKYGNAITSVPAIETIVTTEDGIQIDGVIDREHCRLARAPQSFYLADIIEMHERSIADKYDKMIDSASLMMHYGVKLHLIDGPTENIKITTPSDFYIFRAIQEAKKSMQILGV